MLLMKWQYPSSSQKDQLQSNYYFRSGSYWDNEWNWNQLRYMIPFQKHPYTDAQVSSLIDNRLRAFHGYKIQSCLLGYEPEFHILFPEFHFDLQIIL